MKTSHCGFHGHGRLAECWLPWGGKLRVDDYQQPWLSLSMHLVHSPVFWELRDGLKFELAAEEAITSGWRGPSAGILPSGQGSESNLSQHLYKNTPKNVSDSFVRTDTFGVIHQPIQQKSLYILVKIIYKNVKK